MIQFNGNNTFTSMYLGNTSYSKAYAGDNQVWPDSSPTSFKVRLTYQDGEVYVIPATGSTMLRQGDVTGGTQDKTNIVSAEIGDYVTSIGFNCFNNCSNLTSITIPSSVTSLGDYCFRDCSSLTSIDIPSGVTSLGDYCFDGCYILTSITIPSSVTSLGDCCFSYCNSLTSITIPSGVTSIGDGCFRNSGSLTSITVNATTPPTLGTNTFYNTNNCPIYVPCASVDAYKSAWSTYESRIQCVSPPFSGKLRIAFTPDVVFEIPATGETILRTTDLNRITFSMTKNTYSAEIGDYVTMVSYDVFSGLFGMTSLTISDSVTLLGMEAFMGLSALTTVTIPSGVTSIDSRCFKDCTSLTSITVLATTPPTLGSYPRVFENTNNCPIYVPSASVDTYKTAEWWSDYASRIQAIQT